MRRCLVKNYGSRPFEADVGENFAVFVGSPDPANGENLVVEDCIFAGMSPLLGSGPPLRANGSSVLTLAGGPPKNDLKAGNWRAASSRGGTTSPATITAATASPSTVLRAR